MKPSISKVFLALLAVSATLCEKATAQILPDTTLGAESSIVRPNLNINGLSSDQIEGGATRGTSLFHSFQQFNVGEGRGVYFTHPVGIENILTRVTGNSRSYIQGTLGVLGNGNANLFLINPQGIVFGPNARLDLRGSFIASTASSIKLSDGSFFSTTNPQAPALLAINVPIGLQFGQTPGRIVNQSTVTNSSGKVVGLEVADGQTLALLGGNIELPEGQITAPAGRVALVSVQSGGSVSLAQWPNLALGYEQGQNFGEIQLSQGAKVDTSGARGGDIQVQGSRVSLRDGSQLVNSTFGEGDAANLTVIALESLELSGMRSQGDNLRGGLISQVGPQATGKGGNITAITRRLTIGDGATISTSTFGKGQAGNILVKASESVAAIGDNLGNSSGMFARAGNTDDPSQGPPETGDGGSLTIETGRLLLDRGAQMSVSTASTGNAGNFTIVARESVEVRGRSSDNSFGSGLFAQALGTTGKGGNLTINTRQLTVQGGTYVTVAADKNNTVGAGTLTVNASEAVQVMGTVKNNLGEDAVSRLIGVGYGSGPAGDIRISTGQLIVRDGALISVGAYGTGSAGNVEISASSIQLQNGGKIGATSAAGDRGNITIHTSTLQMRHQANISTNATGMASGGNITINTQTLAALENSDITANAEQSFGGRIEITAQAIFGAEPRTREALQNLLNTKDPKQLDPSKLPSSDITAISQQGGPQLEGTVQIQTPGINPSQGLVELSENLVDYTELIANRCKSGSGNSFTIAGSGGLPPSPSEPLSGNAIWVDLAEPPTVVNQSFRTIHQPRLSSGDRLSVPAQIVEAQGWVIAANGDVILTAQPPNTTTGGSGWKHPQCASWISD